MREPNPMFYGLLALQEELRESGWRIYLDSARGERYGCNWYACLQCKEGPDCLCNDSPPQFVAWPSTFRFSDNKEIRSVEVERTGETLGGVWMRVQAYSIRPDEFVKAFPAIEIQLNAAWAAAAEVR